eukprot:365725-Chlamydomonas_euryale.AAC.16
MPPASAPLSAGIAVTASKHSSSRLAPASTSICAQVTAPAGQVGADSPGQVLNPGAQWSRGASAAHDD